jgi:hypothetical protein
VSRPNGLILYRGPSLLDGAPILVVAIGLATGSTNRKTGDMLQTYILRDDVAPIAAVASGQDASICGDCVHRGDMGNGKGRTCYVNIGQGPTQVWKTAQRGGYPAAPRGQGFDAWADAVAAAGAGRVVRLGTYGDPAAVPAAVWQALTSECIAHTGYTHQWRNPAAAALRTLCMASADSVADAASAQAAGWRTFRVAMPCDSPRERTEAVCPASAEAGRKMVCADCRACAGANGRRGSIVIQAHGGFAVMANVSRRAAMSPSA